MTSHRKSVILKDFTPIGYTPDKNIDVAWKPIDKKNREWFATFYGSTKNNIYTQDINDCLEKLSRNILSDRVRTLNSIPQYHTICDVKEWIQ